jgi:fructose-1,6-bisphosphatase I
MDPIIEEIVRCCIQIHETMQQTIPSSNIGGENSSGDVQKPLDITTDHIIVTELSKIPSVAGLLSEERDGYLPCQSDGQYIISFDPLDGSGNSPLNLSTGSIFAIFKANTLDQVSGNTIVSAVYSIYGSALEIITVTQQTRTRTVYIQTKDSTIPVVVGNCLTVPNRGKIYVINEGNSERWSNRIQQYVGSLKGRSLRWMACFVADVHRLLLEGGVYMYPSDTKQPNGKLRLVYEVYPMAFIWEQCGGISQDETGKSCLDIPFNPTNIHQRVPILLFGSGEYQDWLTNI